MESFKEVKFSVQMNTAYMFDFLYWHSYHGITGIINYALSFAGIAALIAGFGKGNAFVTVMLVALASLFTVVNPLTLLYKAARQVKNSPMFAKTLMRLQASGGGDGPTISGMPPPSASPPHLFSGIFSSSFQPGSYKQ